MLQKSKIWAVSENCTKLEVFKDAFTLNSEGGRNNLSAYDTGHYIKEVLMKEFPEVYPTLDSLEKDLCLDHTYISLVISAYEAAKAQEGKLPEETVTRVTKLTEGQIRPVRKIEDEALRTAAIGAVADNDLSMRDGQKLAEFAQTPEATPTSIAEEAKKIADEKAQGYMKDADRATAKTERARDKVVEVGSEYPEALMKAVFGHLYLLKGKVTPEKAKTCASGAVAVLYRKCMDKKLFVIDAEGQTHPYEPDDLFKEVDRW